MYFYDISPLHLSVVSREIKHKNEECSWVYALSQGCVAIAWIDANLRYFLWQLELIATSTFEYTSFLLLNTKKDISAGCDIFNKMEYFLVDIVNLGRTVIKSRGHGETKKD